MPENQPTQTEQSRQDPFRWSRADIAAAVDDFSRADPSSRRDYARRHDIPHATFDYWLGHHCPDPSDPVDCFFRSAPGESVLRRIVLAALSTFHLQGACGIRTVGEFLRLAQLDRFVGSSRGALHPLACWLQSDLVAFRDQQQPDLARRMDAKSVTLILDEHFHAGKPCLVGMDSVSGFILLECYKDRRDADTWEQAITEGTRDIPVDVIQLTSDRARALLCCAGKALEVAHSPDLWHGQRDLLKPFLLPLNRPIQQARKQLQAVRQRCQGLDGSQQSPELIDAVKEQGAISKRLQQAERHKEEALRQVRGLGDDYHPFDRGTGKAVTAEEVAERLNGRLDKLRQVATEAGLSQKAFQALAKAREWVQTLVGCVAWFWCLTTDRVEELELTEEQERVVKEKLLPGYYWERAAGRARTKEEKKRLKQMAKRLKKEAWQAGSALRTLSRQRRKEVREVAQERAGLFQRSSSAVEGRNGWLSLQHHGHSRVSESRLKALTVMHNYMRQRRDGTTAAQRFFGQAHQDPFSWLLERMPDLPRPAPKRQKTAA